jgi:hypothetical protein
MMRMTWSRWCKKNISFLSHQIYLLCSVPELPGKFAHSCICYLDLIICAVCRYISPEHFDMFSSETCCEI